MSNATNVTFNVTVNSEQVEPKLTFLNNEKKDVSAVFVSKSNYITFSDSANSNQLVQAQVDVSGTVGQDDIYMFNVATDSTLLAKLNALFPNNALTAGSSIGVLQTSPIYANSIDIESFPIISINNFSVISFDTGGSLLKFPDSVSSSTISEVKSKIQSIYPPLISVESTSPLYNVITQLQSDITSGVLSMNAIIDRLTSIKVGSTYIDPSHILFSKTNSSLPIGKPTHQYVINATKGLCPMTINYLPITNISNAFTNINTSATIQTNQVLFSGKGTAGTNIANLSKVSGSTASTDISSAISGKYTVQFPNGLTNPGVYLSAYYTAYNYAMGDNGLSDPIITPSTNLNSSSGYSLFNPTWGTGFNVGTEYQITGDGTYASTDNAMTPFIFPGSTTPPGQLLQTINRWVSEFRANAHFILDQQTLGIALLLQNNTWESVEWNFVGSAAEFANEYFSSSTQITNLNSQLNVFGYSLSSSGTISSLSDNDSIAYTYDGITVEPAKCFSISSIYGTYVNYSVHNFSLSNLSILKEVVSIKDDPFEVIADKALTLRDEFNAKVLSDINCKVMNFPTIEDAIQDYNSAITYFNSLTNGTIPTTNEVYIALTPIFIGALNLGTYFSLIQDLYQCGPFTSIPPSVQLAGDNISKTYKWDQEFPGEPTQLSFLVNGLFLLPSPTSVRADSTSIQTYTLNSTYHIFKTSEKPVTRYVPHHKLTMELTDVSQFDPSVNEVKTVMIALEDIATCMLAASTGYTVSKNAESMLKSLLKRNKLSSLEEMSTSNDPSIQSLYSKFSDWGTQTFHGKSNSVSSQFDHYEAQLFTPDDSNHKKQLSKHMGDLHSIFDAVSLSTFKNSDILGQVSQMASNTFTKHRDCLTATMGKLGTDLLADDSLKLLDHAIEDVVHDSINIAVDVGKVILNMTADILATAADLLSPVSVVTQLYNDLDEHIYNGFSQVPDVLSELFNGSATPGAAWSFSLATIPNMFSYKNGSYYASGDSLKSNPDQYFIQGGLVNPNYTGPSAASINVVNSSSTVLAPYKEGFGGGSSQGAPDLQLLSFRSNDMSLNKPLRFTFHTSVGDAFIYVLNGVSFNSNSNVGNSSNGLSDIIVQPEPVRNYLGVIDPLRTVKKMVEIIYQLPRLFGCSGLFDYLGYKDLWTNFINDVGSQAGANNQSHVATNELIAADSAGSGMALGYTAYAAAEGASFNGSSMVENGIVAVTDATEVGLYTNKVDEINSEPNILSSQNQLIVQQFLAVVMHFIFDGKYAMNGGLLSYLKSHQGQFSHELYNAYQSYSSETLDENEKNRRLCSLLNDYFYGSGVGNMKDRKPGMVETIPNLGDLAYDTTLLGVKINLDSNYRWNDKQVANLQADSSGNLMLMGPVYSPSIVRDFMFITAGLGRIAAGAFLEKRTAQLFLAHAKLSKKLAYIRAKIKKITNSPTKLGKWIGKTAIAKYHRDHNSKSRAKVINAQTAKLESTLTTQTNTLAGDISGINTGMSSLTFGFH